MTGLNTVKNMQRLYIFMSTYFLMISVSGRAVAAGFDPMFFHSCTVLANSVNALTYYKGRKLVQTWVYSIEWDLDTE